MKNILSLIVFSMLFLNSVNAQVPNPSGEWLFDNSADLTSATIGSDLVLVGSHTAVSGPSSSDSAVRIGSGSHYELTHGLASNNGTYVNTYSILFDFKIADISNWRTFFQANAANSDDGELFVRENQGTLGRSITGYSTAKVTTDTWNRLVVVVDNGTEYSLYLNGTKILTGTAQATDGEYALRPTMLLFGDNNGEDSVIDVARVSLYDKALSSSEAESLGGVIPPVVPSGEWLFDNSADLTSATIGSDLVLVGSHTAVSGPTSSEGAVRIGSGSHYELTHGLASNNGTYVNTYSILFDFKIADISNWRTFFQANGANSDDGELFVRKDQGTLGRSFTGYSTVKVTADTWNRLVVVVDNGTEYSLYLNGAKILTGTAQTIDGEYALRPTVLLFGDNNGEDDIMDVARVALYDKALSNSEVESLGVIPNSFLTKAYLQNATTDGITIMWESNSSALGTVNYGISSESYTNSETSNVTVTNAGTYVHKARISGLLEDTTYYYKVTTDGQSNLEQTFKTATSNVNASFKVGVWGDSHYPEPFDFMASYLVDTEHVDFCVNTGDISNSGNTRSDLENVFLPIILNKISSKVPVYAALGNHDVGAVWGGGDLIRQYLDQPTAYNSDPSHFDGSYAFRYGNSVFITIDWNKMNTDADNDLVTDGWLESVLSDPISTGAKYRFIFIHCAPYYERWQEAETHRIETPVKELLPALAEKYGVNAVFSGHMHGYERGYKGDVHYVTQGGGSYMDVGEPIGERYDFIIRGTDKDGGITDFNNGLTNHVLTLEITGTTAQFKLHYFDKNGTYLGLKETVPMFERTLSLTEKTMSNDKVLENKTSFKIVPNPTKGIITVKAPVNVDVYVYNVIGQLVYRKSKLAPNSDINLSYLNKGMYIIKLKGSQGQLQSSKRIVIE